MWKMVVLVVRPEGGGPSRSEEAGGHGGAGQFRHIGYLLLETT